MTIEVLQVLSEMEQLRQLYRERKPKRILEIGSWQGGTLRLWLSGKPEVVVAVDLHHQNPELYEEWKQKGTDLHVIEGDSTDAAIIATIRPLSPFDWIFIDGDHAPEPAFRDACTAIELIAPGGLILLHDIVDQVGGGPAHAFATIGEGYETWEYVDPKPERWGHGIGVIQR